jgi:uncharacterized membrane protein
MATAVTRVRERRSFISAKHLMLVVFAAMTLFVLLTRDRALLDPSSPLHRRYSAIPVLMFLHGFPAAIALFLGFLQFSNRIRQRRLQIHRVMGRIYIACVAISAPAAVVVSIRLPTPNLTMAALIQSFGWLATTATAFYCIRRGKVQQHREWMMRSYPFAMVFVVVRVILAVPAIANSGLNGLIPKVWTVLTIACFLPSFLIEWAKLRNSGIQRRTAAAD